MIDTRVYINRLKDKTHMISSQVQESLEEMKTDRTYLSTYCVRDVSL